jgi:hypothetical protein
VKALGFSRRVQTLPKASPQDKGGWRYLNARGSGDSDLSVTSWELMFFRSARNAEFTVPKEFVDDAVGYVLRCWEETQGIFYYKKSGNEQRWSRGMVGAGVLSLAMAGQHQTRVAQRAGDWLLSRPFQRFGETVGGGDRFYYSAYYCSQAMASWEDVIGNSSFQAWLRCSSKASNHRANGPRSPMDQTGCSEILIRQRWRFYP